MKFLLIKKKHKEKEEEAKKEGERERTVFIEMYFFYWLGGTRNCKMLILWLFSNWHCYGNCLIMFVYLSQERLASRNTESILFGDLMWYSGFTWRKQPRGMGYVCHEESKIWKVLSMKKFDFFSATATSQAQTESILSGGTKELWYLMGIPAHHYNSTRVWVLSSTVDTLIWRDLHWEGLSCDA